MGLNYYEIKKNILRARKLVIRATSIAGSGHPGGSFSMAEILGCLFYKYLKFSYLKYMKTNHSEKINQNNDNQTYTVNFSDIGLALQLFGEHNGNLKKIAPPLM